MISQWAPVVWTQAIRSGPKKLNGTEAAGEFAKIFALSKWAAISGLFRVARTAVLLAPARCSRLPTSTLVVWWALDSAQIWR